MIHSKECRDKTDKIHKLFHPAARRKTVDDIVIKVKIGTVLIKKLRILLLKSFTDTKLTQSLNYNAN